jgi:hypothetical protein
MLPGTATHRLSPGAAVVTDADPQPAAGDPGGDGEAATGLTRPAVHGGVGDQFASYLRTYASSWCVIPGQSAAETRARRPVGVFGGVGAGCGGPHRSGLALAERQFRICPTPLLISCKVLSVTPWWELAIPAASAIAGSVVTGLMQGAWIRSQRKDERRMRFIDNKRSTYAQFLVIWDQFTQLGREANDMKQFVGGGFGEQLDAMKARCEQLQQDSSKDQELVAARVEYAKALGDLIRFKKRSEIYSAKANSIFGEPRDYYYNLRLLAPASVRNAADRMLDSQLIMSNDSALLDERREAFEEAARKDLL